MNKTADLFKNKDGAILVPVLLILVIMILIGTTYMRSTRTETKIAGNERSYHQDFYACEAAGELTKERFDSIVSGLILLENTTADVSASVNGTGPVNDAKVTITLVRSGNPPDSSGTSAASNYANFYEISSTVNGKTIRKGVWKAFPKSE